MNEVYLSGKLVAIYAPEAPASQPKHLVYQLRVSHKTAQQQVKFENYTVNAWRNLATWAEANLRVGMEVIVRGHLSQRLTSAGMLTEVTALRIAPLLASRNAQASAVVVNANPMAEVPVADKTLIESALAFESESAENSTNTAEAVQNTADECEDETL